MHKSRGGDTGILMAYIFSPKPPAGHVDEFHGVVFTHDLTIA